MSKVLILVSYFHHERSWSSLKSEKFLRLKRLIILKYVHNESIKIVTFLKKRKTISLLLEMTLLLYDIFNMFKKVESSSLDI